MQETLEFRKGVLFIRISGKLSKYYSKKLNNYLISVIMKHGVKYLVINFNDLVSIDKYGITTINNIIYSIINNCGITYIVKNNMNLKFRNTKEIKNELEVFELVEI